MDVVYQFGKGDSYVHRLDAVTKTVVVFAISLLAFGNFLGIFQLVMMLSTIFIALVLAKLKLSLVYRATKWLVVACIMFFLVQTWMLRVPGEVVVFTLGSKVIYLEVLDYAAAVSMRIYTIFLASFIFIRTTHPRDLVVSFVQILKIPYKIPYAFFIALRIIPLIEKEARCINEAHMVRGIGEKAGLKGKIENLKRFTVPLLIRSLRDASVTTHSMESRGFGAYEHRNYVDEISMSTAGRIIVYTSIIAVLVLYTLIFTGIVPFQYSVH